MNVQDLPLGTRGQLLKKLATERLVRKFTGNSKIRAYIHVCGCKSCMYVMQFSVM